MRGVGETTLGLQMIITVLHHRECMASERSAIRK